MKVSENFLLQEFIPKSIYDRFGVNSIWFIDDRIIKVAQYFRDKYNLPITINDWHTGGNRQYSGFRPPDCEIGAELSQHRAGRACDLKFLGQDDISIDDIRENIRANQKEFYDIGLRAVEEGTDTWLHLSVQNTNLKDEILFIGFWSKK